MTKPPCHALQHSSMRDVKIQFWQSNIMAICHQETYSHVIFSFLVQTRLHLRAVYDGGIDIPLLNVYIRHAQKIKASLTFQKSHHAIQTLGAELVIAKWAQELADKDRDLLTWHMRWGFSWWHTQRLCAASAGLRRGSEQQVDCSLRLRCRMMQNVLTSVSMKKQGDWQLTSCPLLANHTVSDTLPGDTCQPNDLNDGRPAPLCTANTWPGPVQMSDMSHFADCPRETVHRLVDFGHPWRGTHLQWGLEVILVPLCEALDSPWVLGSCTDTVHIACRWTCTFSTAAVHARTDAREDNVQQVVLCASQDNQKYGRKRTIIQLQIMGGRGILLRFR